MKQILLLVAFISLSAVLNAQANTSYKFTGEQSVFTENKGQVVDMNGQPVPDVLAKASMPGLDMYLTKTGVTYVLLQYTEDLTAKPHPVFINDKKFKVTYSRVDVALAGATITNRQMQFTGQAGYQSNYYKTADAKGQLAVSHFTNMTVQNVYPGIDWVWKFNAKGSLEYEFVVHPGADPALIKMQYSYADLKVGKNELVISTRIGSMTEGPLQASCGGGRVGVNYNLNPASKEISFQTISYDKNKDLVIDPPLALNWSAQFGGSFLNGLRGVTTDYASNVYLVGYTTSNDFPTFNPRITNEFLDTTFNGLSDAILLKMDTNQHLKWATYMGGPGNDFANSVCYTINTNQIYVTGGAASGFPVLYGAGNHGGQDAFIAAFNSYLQLTTSSFYGGNGTDEGLKICVDKNTSCYMTGYTNSTASTFATYNYLGGYHQTTVTNTEAFIMGFNLYGGLLYNSWSTFYGGNGNDYGTAITTDTLNNIIVGGYTTSTNIPVLASDSAYYQSANAGGNDGFILKFSAATTLLNATYYGGTGDDYITDAATGINGNFAFTGRTNSTNFPLRAIGGYGYYQSHLADATDDAFIIKAANNLTVKWATYYGGGAMDAGTGVATDKTGRIYVTGFTFSHNFPIDSFPGAYNQSTNHGNSDGFIARFSDLGVRDWSTYKGDSCYQYPYEIAYDKLFTKFYVAGEGMLSCIGDTAGQSLPDTGQVNANGVSSVGFAWAFSGDNVNPCASFSVGVNYIEQPCPGQCNGIALATAGGGRLPYSYIWSDGTTTTTDSNSCPQESWVEVRDSLGCVAQTNLTWNPVNVSVIITDIICLPGPGSLQAVATGGNGHPDLYKWSTSGNVFSDSTIIMVTDTGSYSVTVEDARGCTVSATSILGFNNVYPNAYIEVLYYPSCGQNQDGVVAFDYPNTDAFFPNGNIVWEDANLNVIAYGDTFYNASANLTPYYAVDSAYCYNGVTSPVYYQFNLDNSTNTAILQANGPSTCVSDDGQGYVYYNTGYAYISQGNINSSFNNTTIVVDNYPTVSYAWSDGQVGQSDYFVGIGTTNVTVTDGFCQTVLSTTNNIQGPTANFNTDSAYCNGGDIFVTAYSQYGNLTYQWAGISLPVSGSGTNLDISNLPAQLYEVIVTDGGGCGDTAFVYVPQGTPVEANVTFTNALCFGGEGVVTVSAEFGTPPYNIGGHNISSPPYQYSAPVPIGSMVFYVYDANGCSASGTATVTEPSLLTITTDSIAPAVCGSGTETINVTASGGTAPYTGTGTQFEPVGTDVVTVTDADGCTASNTLVVIGGSSAPVIINSSFSPILCYGGTTNVIITASGGHGTLTGTGTFTETAGTHYFTVTDSVGCSAVDTVVIGQPGQISVSVTSPGITCSPSAVNASVTGGSGPYQYEWNTSPGFGDSATVYVSIPNDYAVTVLDGNGCIGANDDYVDYHNAPIHGDSFLIVQYPVCGLNNGVIICNSPDPSKITWVSPAGNIIAYGDTLRGVSNTDSLDFYTLYDSSGCINGVPQEYSIDFFSPVSVNSYSFALDNPSGCNTKDGSISLSSYWGLLIFNLPFPTYNYQVNSYASYQYQWSNGLSYTTDTLNLSQSSSGFSLNNVNSGNYSVTVTDGSCQRTFNFNLVDTTQQVVANYTITEPLCGLTGNGSIQLSSLANNSYSGQTYVDTFAWSNGATTQSVTNLTGGNYEVTITGPNACPVIDTFIVAAPLISLTVGNSITPILCYNGNATVTVTATGGTLPYTGTGVFYESAGNYVLTVSDASGCSTNDSIVVPPSLATSALSENSSVLPAPCHGDNATITINATGGIAPYTGTGSYQKPAGTYIMTVTDSLGCSASDTLDITQPGILFVTNVVNPVPCYGGNATVSLTCRGGTSPYTGVGAFSKPVGDYVFDITDANGCVATDTVVVTQPTPLVVTDTVTANALCNGGTGIVHITATGGTAPYYGAGNIVKPAGNYLLVVSDNNGCADSVNATITQPTVVDVNIQWIDTIAPCRDTVKIAVSATGGTSPYTGIGTSTYTHNGNYTITVTDANGCMVDSTLSIHLDTCTGVETIAEDFGVSIYPNPAADMFYVKFASPLTEPADVRLYAVDGKLVMLKTLGAGNDITEINCNQLAGGVYVLRTAVTGKEYNFKVVVTR